MKKLLCTAYDINPKNELVLRNNWVEPYSEDRLREWWINPDKLDLDFKGVSSILEGHYDSEPIVVHVRILIY